MLQSSSLLCLPHDRPMNLRDKVFRQGNMTLLGKLADQEDSRLMSESILSRIWMPGSFIESDREKQ